MPRVSVIIPTYNRAHLITKTLDSVIAQTYQDFEIIVVDDGSIDDTQNILSGYEESVKYLRQENAGQAAARNAGIRRARGDYIAFVDSDDLWLPTKLEKQMAELLAVEDMLWIYCDTEVFAGANNQTLHNFSQINQPYQGWIAPQLLLRDFIASPTPIVHRTVFEVVGFFEESFLVKGREDWDMWLRIAVRYPVIYVPEVLARYRLHDEGTTHQEDIWQVHQSRGAVIERAITFAPDVYKPVYTKALAALYLYTGRQLALAGNAEDARALFAQVIALMPGKLDVYLYWFACLFGSPGSKAISRLMLWLRGKWYLVRLALTKSGKG